MATYDVPVGTVSGAPRRRGGATIADDEDFLDHAAAARRALIRKVPGSGPVRGVWSYMGDVFAVRDNAGGTAGVIHRATAAGWTAIPLGHSLSFDAGTVEPSAGDRISVAGAGVATLLGYRVASGDWGDGDAVGTLYVQIESGAFADDAMLRRGAAGSEANFATADGTPVAHTLPAGGRYYFLNHNFEGMPASEKAFGVNGKGRAFSLHRSRVGGVTRFAFAPIHARDEDDTPNHVAVQNNHLLLGYPGGRLIGSETGNPDGYTAAQGAVDIGCGQEINGMLGGVGLGNTVILGADHIQVLYGNDSTDFVLQDQSQSNTGGVEGTMQAVGGPLYLDNRGVRSLTTTDAWGNWVIGTMTADVQPWLDRQREARNVAAGSMRVRSSDQYRLWFESGLGLAIYVGRGHPEISFIDYGTDPDDPTVRILPRCSVSAEDADRIERIWFGADNGFVYEAERGTSFDGRPFESYIRLPLNSVKQPSRQKRFHSVDVHADVNGRATVSLSALYDDGNYPDQLPDDADFIAGGSFWSEGIWSEFNFNAPLNGYRKLDLAGIGRNISMILVMNSAKQPPITLNGLSLHHSPRRGER